MAKEHLVTDEEMDRIERDDRHKELLAALSQLVPQPVDLSKVEGILTDLLSKEAAEVDNKDLLAAIEGLRKAIESRPKSFRVVRGKMGFIEQLIAE